MKWVLYGALVVMNGAMFCYIILLVAKAGAFFTISLSWMTGTAMLGAVLLLALNPPDKNTKDDITIFRT